MYIAEGKVFKYNSKNYKSLNVAIKRWVPISDSTRLVLRWERKRIREKIIQSCRKIPKKY